MPGNFSLVQVSVAEKKQGAYRLVRCQQRAQAQTYPWGGGGGEGVADLFCAKTRGVCSRGFVTLRPTSACMKPTMIYILRFSGNSSKLGPERTIIKKTRVCIEEEFPSPHLSELLLILINFLQQIILLIWDISKVKGLTYYGKSYFKQS